MTWWVAVLVIVALALPACSNDNSADPTEADADATAAPTSNADARSEPTSRTDEGANGGDAENASAAGAMILGGEEIAISLRCFFEEQPRAGLGGVFTHSAQGRGTNAEGEPVVLDLTRARAEDGTVGDDINVDIGDPFGDDMVSLRAVGPEGLIQFGEASASADDVEVSQFGAEPVSLSFDLACG